MHGGGTAVRLYQHPMPGWFLVWFQSGAYSEQVEDTLKEYVRMVLSFKASGSLV